METSLKEVQNQCFKADFYTVIFWLLNSYNHEQILQEVSVAKYGDEATDASNCEQLSVVLHFVDKANS